MVGTTKNDSRLVLVVGGAGYVGSVMIRRLLGQGYRVRVLDKLIFNHGASLSGVWEQPGFEFMLGDARDRAAVDRALEGVTDVVLLAGLVGDPVCKTYPELAREINEVAAQGIFAAAEEAGVARLVFTSTCSNYGLRDSDEPATEESDLAPVSTYAEAKVAFEKMALAGSSGKLASTVLRISTAYGMSPRMRFDLTISEFTRALAAGEQLVVYDADTWRPYCHVEDIAKGVETVLSAPLDQVDGEVFNVGHSDENYTKRMLVDTIGNYLDIEGQVEFVEGGTDPRNYRVSFEKIAERLGYVPDYRVPESVARLAAAVHSGVYDDFADRKNYYTNHVIPQADELLGVGA